MWYVLYTKIQANGGRKKREVDVGGFLQEIPLYISGLFTGNVYILYIFRDCLGKSSYFMARIIDFKEKCILDVFYYFDNV